jgi:replicative DNA helicase
MPRSTGVNMIKLGQNILKIAHKMVAPDVGVKTGFTDLDAMTLGLHGGELIIVAGRPSMGKSSYLLQMAWQMDRPILFGSAEMSEQMLGERLISQISGIGLHRIKGQRTSLSDKERAKRAVQDISSKEIYVIDDPSLSPDMLRSAMKDLTPSCVFVDYLQLLSISTFGGMEEKVSALSKELKSIAMDFDLPLVAASQMNRESDKRDNHIPRLSDLRGSGSIEQDADLVLMLHRPSYYLLTEEDPDAVDDGESWLYVSKNRNGPVGKIKYKWSKETMSFSEQSAKYKKFGALI